MADEKKTPTQPAAAPAKDRVATLEQENETLRAQLARTDDRLANLEKLLASQEPVLSPLKKAQEREEEFKRQADFNGKSCVERTQITARKLFTDSTHEIPVKIVNTNKKDLPEVMPEILIPARNTDEATGRYNRVMGITSNDSQNKYVFGKPVPVPAPQQAA